MDLPIDTNSKVGAPVGNDNAKKGKMFYDQLRKVLVQNDQFKLRKISDQLVDMAIKGEAWAIKEVIDRMDGKAVATQEVTGLNGAELKTGFTLVFEEPANGNDSGS
jgi:hypothetical protein